MTEQWDYRPAIRALMAKKGHSMFFMAVHLDCTERELEYWLGDNKFPSLDRKAKDYFARWSNRQYQIDQEAKARKLANLVPRKEIPKDQPKKCPKCGDVKPRFEFTSSGYCKPCHLAYNRVLRQNQRQAKRQGGERWQS